MADLSKGGLKFNQRYTVRKNLTPKQMARGIWNPRLLDWRDCVEDYLYISKKRFDNKWAIFMLQLHIFHDIASNIKNMDQYRQLENQVTEDFDNGKISEEDLILEKDHIASELYGLNLLNKALREIMDGLVWRCFDYNRAILQMLASKQPIETLRMDHGTITNLYEFADVFLNEDSFAIYNDITNFLRVGDVTRITKDGTIEIIEVKSGEKRAGRITRQRERMSELINFFNTGFTIFDGKTMKIVDSDLKQKTHLSLLRDGISQARRRGLHSFLVGEHLIVEIVDLSKANEIDDIVSFFESKHKSVRDEWHRRHDFVIRSFFLEKMEYAKNCAPFSIYPLDIETCTDIMMGRLSISVHLNFSQLLRIMQKDGWRIVDSIIFRTPEEIKAFEGKDMNDISYLRISKGNLTFEVPPAWFARLQYELLAPSTLMLHLQEVYARGPHTEYDYFLSNYVDEKRVWH
jgi:hypothetical protein